MKTWAHGDVADALGRQRPAPPRPRAVAELGFQTRGLSYAIRGVTMPDAPGRVELTGPGGQVWAWGPPDAMDGIKGRALNFCLRVIQLRHQDLALTVTGTAAEESAGIAQEFAGAPGPGRELLR